MRHAPDQLIELAGKSYTLRGTFRTLAAVEEALDKDILTIQSGVFDLKLSDLAKLLSAAITASGDTLTIFDAGQALTDLGLTSDAYALVRYTVMGWLLVALTPPESRAQKAKDLGEVLAKASPASLGASTEGSASA